MNFADFGGVQVPAAVASPTGPAIGTVAWNFGVTPEVMSPAAQALPSLHEAFPNLGGAWDGKTSVNHHEAVRKVLGVDLPAHFQPRGTCGGRAGSRCAELLQCVLIASGTRAKFRYVSHAWIYYLARKKYNQVRPGGERNDGVALGSVGDVLAESGLLNRDESGDSLWDGKDADVLAVKWGNYGMSADEEARLKLLASDNIVTARVRCRTAQELADAIAAGGVGLCSDSQGYTTVRDAEGFCRPSGEWWHYHVRSGVRINERGRKGFDYNQSWGPSMPSGALLPGCPSNCFGVDWDVQDRLCRTAHVEALLAFPLWDLEAGPRKLPWVFA